MNRKRKHPRLLALVKVIVAYKLTHSSGGHLYAGSHEPKSFIWWTAHDAFIWCEDAWVKTIVEWPGLNQLRAYWTPTKLARLWKRRLSQNGKERLVKEAIATLRKENKVAVVKRVQARTVWKGRRPTDEKKICVYWEYRWCENTLDVLGALGM
jgi:hypothetical protein